MPLTSPGNDDGTGEKPSAHTAEKHCRTRPTNIEAIHSGIPLANAALGLVPIVQATGMPS